MDSKALKIKYILILLKAFIISVLQTKIFNHKISPFFYPQAKGFVFILLSIAWMSCDRYNPVNEEINELPKTKNYLSATSFQALEDAIKEYPNAPENYYQLARLHHFNQNDSLANFRIKEAMKLDSNQVKYRYLYSQILYKQDKKEESLNQLLRISGANTPPSIEQLFLAARLYYDLKDYDNATKYLNRALKIDNKNPDFYLWKGKVAVARRDSSNALDNLRQALALKPNFAEAYNSLTELYTKYELYISANRFANIGLKYKPDYAELYFHKAEAFRKRVYFDDSAKIAYQKAFELDKNQYKAAYYLGKFAYEKGQCEQVKTYLEHALKYQKELDKAHYYLGVCYRRSGNKDTALKWLALELKQNPNYFPASDLYWGIKNEIAQAKIIAREDSLRRAYYKQLEEQRQRALEQQNNK